MDLFENPLVVAKHAAEREIRDAFQARWGEFWKCRACGARFENDGPVLRVSRWAHPAVHASNDPACVWRVGEPPNDERAGYSDARLETIAAAAILIDGKVWSVPPPGRHRNVFCLYSYGSSVHPPAEGAPELREQGFVTSTGRFVDRREGLRIAVAAGQYRGPASSHARNAGRGFDYNGSELFSEDVW